MPDQPSQTACSPAKRCFGGARPGRESRRQRVAIHEAGHAVAALVALRTPPRYATIAAGPEFLGHIRLPMPRNFSNPTMQQGVANMVVCLAGNIAAVRAGHRPPRADWEQDRQQAIDYALMIGGPDEADLFYRLAKGRAHSIIESRWPAIERVAAALIERERLAGAEIAEMAAQAMVEAAQVKLQPSAEPLAQ